MAKLNRFKLIDVQSWSGDSDWVDMDTEYTNIIIGRNETGKSVLFKMLCQMFIPSTYGKHRDDLIRDGAQCAISVFELDTGVVIVFIVFRNNTQQYQIIWPNGDKLKVDGDEPPEELAREFNWFVDRKEGIILNLLHNESDLPLVNTTPTWNAKLLKFLTEHPALESIRERFQMDSQRILAAMVTTSNNLDKIRYRYDSIERMDVVAKRAQLEICEKYMEVWTAFSAFADELRKLHQLPEVPKFRLLDEDAKQFIRMLRPFAYFHQTSLNLLNALEVIPEKQDYSMLPKLESLANMEQIVNGFNKSSAILFKNLASISDPVDYSYLGKLEQLANAEAAVSGLGTSVQTLLTLLERIPEPFEVPMDKLAELVKVDSGASKMSTGLARLFKNLQDTDVAAVTIEKYETELNQIKKELGLCPTCGRAFDNVSHDCP